MKLILILAALISSSFAWATPAQILIIRHAEKPDTSGDKGLSPQGEERAQALVGFFQQSPEVTQYGLPVAIFAMSDAGGRTQRPIQTVTPLSEAIGVPITTVVEDDANAMIQEIASNSAYDGHMVLICWVHQDIPAIAQSLGATNAPGKWDKDAYDRVWEINYSGNQAVSFGDLPQHLMPGDSSN
jgi:hypothetical protein